VCLLLRVTVVDKNKAVVCCLLATSAIMLSEKKKRKRKMWSKKWYLKSNILCDAHLLNELLETNVPWDDTIVVSAGKLRKQWDSLSELRNSQCERWLRKGQFWGLLYHLSNCAVYSVFPSGMTSHSKIAHFNWECIAPLTTGSCSALFCHVNLSCSFFVQLFLLIDDVVTWSVLLVHLVILSSLFVCYNISHFLFN
jgi:hypothetical protein